MRPPTIVGNYKYSGTDAYRTLLSVGSLWRHHLHDVKLDPTRVASVAEDLANSLTSLVDLDDRMLELELGARLEQLGEETASKFDEIDPQKLNTWLANLWPTFAKLHNADTQNLRNRMSDKLSASKFQQIAFRKLR